ncbi:MAG: serine/threonine protein kinase [bacterium]
MQKIIIIEEHISLTRALLVKLERHFPAAHYQYWSFVQWSAQAKQLNWGDYDLILLSCVQTLIQQQHYLMQWQQQQSINVFRPIIIFLAHDYQSNPNNIEQTILQMGADDIFYNNNSVSDLVAKLEEQRETQLFLQRYPLQLDDYKIQGVIHDSENAVIYQAIRLHQPYHSVAIKRFKYDLGNLPIQTIESLSYSLAKKANVKHYGVVQIENAGMTPEAFYLVMEYVAGADLKRIMDSHGTPPLTQAFAWFIEITEALAAIHDTGLLHRDLKTSNILLRADGSLALTDYGVEKSVLIDTGFLGENEIFCTPYYVSPERITGEACTTATDIYSLGIIFYELLTGKKPFDGNSLTELMTQHVLAPIPQLPEHLSAYQSLLEGMLDKLPEYRFNDCHKILAQLKQPMTDVA